MFFKRYILIECILLCMGPFVHSIYGAVEEVSWNSLSEYRGNFASGDLPGSDTVEIKDVNFLNALIDWGYDKDGDDVISRKEAEAVLSLWISYRNIHDLTGIEVFTNLETLSCSGNQLTSLDLSGCTSLTVLNCDANILSELDLSYNDDLTELDCRWNELVSLNVTNSEYLVFLECSHNQLTGLDVSNNTMLKELYPGWNRLTHLDVSGNSALEILYCSENELTSLKLSKNVSLIEIHCEWNELVSLNVSGCENLVFLDCGVNQLTVLDVSNNMLLEKLYCGWNQLSDLDVSRNSLLEILYCTANQISSLDLSNSLLLQELYCGWNQFSNLNLVNSNDLRVLHCSDNQLYNLDISQNPSLESIEFEYMPDLCKVCVWSLPFPPDSLELSSDGSPQIYFTTICGDMKPPKLEILGDSLYKPGYIDAISSEGGTIYLVPENTLGNLAKICAECLDSIPAVAGEIVNVLLADLTNGVYWLYARDNAYNISDHKEFRISGVGIHDPKNERINIYPNPVRDVLNIEFPGPGNYTVEISSINGQTILKHNMHDTTERIDLSAFRSGLYFITIRSQGSVITRKIIIL